MLGSHVFCSSSPLAIASSFPTLSALRVFHVHGLLVSSTENFPPPPLPPMSVHLCNTLVPVVARAPTSPVSLVSVEFLRRSGLSLFQGVANLSVTVSSDLNAYTCVSSFATATNLPVDVVLGSPLLSQACGTLLSHLPGVYIPVYVHLLFTDFSTFPQSWACLTLPPFRFAV